MRVCHYTRSYIKRSLNRRSVSYIIDIDSYIHVDTSGNSRRMTKREVTVCDSCCQKHSNAGRVTLVHNPSDDVTPSADKHVTSRAVHAAMQTLPAGQAKMFVTKLVKEEFVEQLESGEKTLEDLAVSVSADVGRHTSSCNIVSVV